MNFTNHLQFKVTSIKIQKALLFIALSFFILIPVLAQNTYQKTYFDNGNLKEEGWIKNTKKNAYWKFYYPNEMLQKEGRFSENKEVKYWYFYHENGVKESEGHFINGTKNKWWIFYDENGVIDYKCQFKNNLKNGYCFLYKNKKVAKAEKYKNGQKIKEWTDMKSFRKENKLSDLK